MELRKSLPRDDGTTHHISRDLRILLEAPGVAETDAAGGPRHPPADVTRV